VRVPVTIEQVSAVDSAATDGLADDLAGESRQDAERIAGAVAGVDGVTIEVAPSWLPNWARDRMPVLPQRIEVETQ
jgi:hypothetical protein